MRKRIYRLLGVLLLAACARQATEQPSPRGRVDVAGGQLAYRMSGQGDPVLLIHGAVFADAFELLRAEPALAGYRLITYHRRGYGDSSPVRAPFTIEQQAADAFALLDALGVRRAHVAGHSYGGAIGLQMAATSPVRIATLTLLEPGIFEMNATTQAVFAQMGNAIGLYGRGDVGGALREMTNTLVAPGAWEGMGAAPGGVDMQQQAIRDAGTFFTVEMPAAEAWRFTFDDVARLALPVLNVVGGSSIPMFQETHAAIKRALPNAESVNIEGSAHELQMSNPRAVAEAVAAFLKRHPL